MPTSMFLYRKDGDGRLWVDTDAELAPDNDIGLFKSRLPIKRGHVKAKRATQYDGQWPTSSVAVFYDQNGATYRVGDYHQLLDLIELLSAIRGITAIGISRYTVTVDKTRAVQWSVIIPQLADVISRITGMNVVVEGHEEFLADMGEERLTRAALPEIPAPSCESCGRPVAEEMDPSTEL